jgi:hypothetical protein
MMMHLSSRRAQGRSSTEPATFIPLLDLLDRPNILGASQLLLGDSFSENDHGAHLLLLPLRRATQA